jgi:hypothetical protein
VLQNLSVGLEIAPQFGQALMRTALPRIRYVQVGAQAAA